MDITITEGDRLIARIPLSAEAPPDAPARTIVLRSLLPQSIRVARAQDGALVLLSRTDKDGHQLLSGGDLEVILDG